MANIANGCYSVQTLFQRIWGNMPSWGYVAFTIFWMAIVLGVVSYVVIGRK